MPYKQATPSILTTSGRQNSLKSLNHCPTVNSYRDRTRPANKTKHFGLTDLDDDHESFKGGIRDLNLQPLSPNLSHDSIEKQSTSSGNTPLKKAQLKKTTHPRKFLSPYLMFLKEKRAEFLDAENRGDMSASDIMRMIRQMWHSMDEKEKERYQELSGRDKDRYEKELKERNITDRKRRRPLGKPKKSLSTYMIFVREMRKQIAEESPGMEVLEIMKEVGRRWRLLREEDKIPLQKKADQDKLRYNKEMRKYVQQQQAQQHQQQLGKRAKVKKATGSDSNESNFEDEEEDSEFTESPKKRKKREHASKLFSDRSVSRIQTELKDKFKQEDSNQNRVLHSEKENLNKVNGIPKNYHREPFSECKQSFGTPPFPANQNSVPLHPNSSLSIEIPHSLYSQQKAPEYSFLTAHYTGCPKPISNTPAYPCDIGVALPPLKTPQEIPEIDLSSAQSPSIFSSAFFQSSPQNFQYFGSGGMTPSPIFFRPSLTRRTSGFAPRCPGFYPFEDIKPEGHSGSNPYFKFSNPLESPRVSCDFGTMFNYVDSNTNNGHSYETLPNEEYHNQYSNVTFPI